MKHNSNNSAIETGDFFFDVGTHHPTPSLQKIRSVDLANTNWSNLLLKNDIFLLGFSNFAFVLQNLYIYMDVHFRMFGLRPQ